MRERQFEVLGYAIGAVVILLYIVVNFAAKGEEGQPIRLVCGLSAILVGGPFLSSFSPLRFGLCCFVSELPLTLP